MHFNAAVGALSVATLVASFAPCQYFVRKIPDVPALAGATDVAVDGAGNLWVVTTGGEVVKLSPAGQELLRIAGQFRSGTSPNRVMSPTSVAIGGAGDVLVTSGTYYVLRFDLDGHFLSWFGGVGTANGKFTSVGEVTVAPSGDVYAVDIGRNRVQRFDQQGNWLATFGTQGTGSGQFYFRDVTNTAAASIGIAVSSTGDVFVADPRMQRVQRWSASGVYVASFPASFPTNFGGTHADLVLDASGRLVLATAGTAVQVFATSGQPLDTLPVLTIDGIAGHPTGLGRDAQGDLYLSDDSGRVARLTPGLQVAQVYSSGRSLAPGRFDACSGVAFDVNGDLLVADGSTRLQRFATSGVLVGQSTWDAGGHAPRVPGSRIARDAAGSLYTLAYDQGAYTVLKCSAGGVALQAIGSIPDAPSGERPSGIAIDGAGDVLVSSAWYAAPSWFGRLRRYDAAGNLLTTLDVGGDLADVAVDARGQILLADRSQHVVHVLDPGGQVLRTLPVRSGTLGASPSSLAIDAADRVFVGTLGYGVFLFDAAGNKLATFAAGDGAYDGLVRRCDALAVHGDLLATADSVSNRAQLYDVARLDQQVPVVTVTSPPRHEWYADASFHTVVTTGSSFALEARISDDNPTTVTSGMASGSILSSTLFTWLPAGGGAATGTCTWRDGADYRVMASVNARDTAGNSGGTTLYVIRDTTPPVLDVVHPVDQTVVGTPEVRVILYAQDLSRMSLRISSDTDELTLLGGVDSWSVDVPFTLHQGTNVIRFEVTDAAGHTTSTTRTVIANLTVPLVEFVGLGGPNDPTCFGPGQSPLPVTVRVEDLAETTVSSAPGAIADALPPGGGLASGSWNLQEGFNTLVVTATATDGRAGAASVTVLYDATPPSVAFDPGDAGQVVTGTFGVAVRAEDPFAGGAPGSGVRSVVFEVDGVTVGTVTEGSEGVYELSLDTAAYADGTYTLVATASDRVGNTSTDRTTFTVDHTGPTVTITSPLDAALVGGDRLPFTADASDANGLLWVRMEVAGAAPNATDGSATYATPVTSATVTSAYDTVGRFDDGVLLLRVIACDTAGNVTEDLITVTVDNTAPDRTLVSPADGAVVSGVVPIVAVADDPHLTSLVVKVDGEVVGSTSAGSLTVPFDTTARGDGPMTIEVVVTDAAHNTSTCTATVHVANLAYRFTPKTLNLKNKGQGVVSAHLQGATVASLLPLASLRVELRVAGGNAVPALRAGGVGDDDGDGIADLTIHFDRTALINSVNAGILGGFLPAQGLIDVELWIDGAFVGTSPTRLNN